MLSTAKAELGALFINAKQAAPMKQTLLELGHPQPPTLVQTNNSRAFGMVTNKKNPKATKAINKNRNKISTTAIMEKHILLTIRPSITPQPITNTCKQIFSLSREAVYRVNQQGREMEKSSKNRNQKMMLK